MDVIPNSIKEISSGKFEILIMIETVLKVENLSKQYRLGEVGTGTLSHDLKKWWYLTRGKEDPYLKIGEVNDRTKSSESEYVWALQNINFEVEQGEALGIIGRNGAGKSTLLKLLSKTTTPTQGNIKVKGRIASLLEVGTGFHPEMTGRENVFLNGSILGMTRKEIKQQFDAIVDFAGVERYIDTPVKRYSSGMHVRLAFAVAAHLESEILIVDEVLAVGDAEFQAKCLGKMKDISGNNGRTVLFVSHNMGAVQQLCTTSLVISNGQSVFRGPAHKGIDFYLNTGNKSSEACYINEFPKPTDIVCVRVLNEKEKMPAFNFRYQDNILIEFTVCIEQNYKDCFLIFRMKDQTERVIFSSEFGINTVYTVPGRYVITASIPGGILVPNHYIPIVALHIPNVEYISYLESSVGFVIEETGSDFLAYAGTNYGCVFVNCEWKA